MCGMHWNPDVLSDGLERKETAASLKPVLGGRAETTRPSLSALGAWGPWRAPVARGSGEPRRPSGARPWSAVPPHAPSALRRRPATRVGALPGSPAVCDDDPPDLGDTKAGRHLSARETRLLTKAVCNTRTRCWEWRGWKVGGPSGGYGQIKDNGKGRRAHRVAHETFVGEIPEGLQVLHHCDNPPCINPEHLYLGTPADNGRDMAVRGRRPKRLSDQDVLRIREEKAQGRSLRELADKYGVSHRHIWDVASGRKRRHVKLPPAGSVRAW